MNNVSAKCSKNKHVKKIKTFKKAFKIHLFSLKKQFKQEKTGVIVNKRKALINKTRRFLAPVRIHVLCSL